MRCHSMIYNIAIVSRKKEGCLVHYDTPSFYFNTPPCFFNSYCKDFPNVAQKREKRASQLYDL